MEIVVAVFVCILVFLLLRKLSGGGKRPPGPWGLPIIGYLPFLSRTPHLDLQKLAQKYGNVFSIRLGSQDLVVLNDFESTKEAFAQDAFIGRPPDFVFVQNETTKASGAYNGLPWKEQRKFSLHSLRDLGFGKSKAEQHMLEEISELLDHVEENGGKPFLVRDAIASSVSNNVASLVFGRRFSHDDPNRELITQGVKDVTMAAGQVQWHLFFPWIRNTFRFLGIGDLDRMYRFAKPVRDLVKKEIEEHEKTLDPENVRDFIDRYLLEIKKRNDPLFNKDVLQDIVTAFFTAGSETARLSVDWLTLRAAASQDSQRKIQAEIDTVIGRNRPPAYTDTKDMPYTQAFMLELGRWRTLVPLNLLRYTFEDTELNGYYIPKHTQVLSNIWAVHHNPKYWGSDVAEFRPERFLTEDGKAVKKMDHNIPFSIGKRACPGEPMAKVEIFLYFVSILQRFDVLFPDGKSGDFEGILGVTLNPKPQPIIFRKRN